MSTTSAGALQRDGGPQMLYQKRTGLSPNIGPEIKKPALPGWLTFPLDTSLYIITKSPPGSSRDFFE